MGKLKALLQKLLGKKAGQAGFTLIEIVIVLAIAGLIFVIVFLAVSAAQSSRRDQARKADASRFAAAASQYQSNDSTGSLPSTGWNGATYYTAGNETTVQTVSLGSAVGNMFYTKDAKCGVAGTSSREYKVEVVLEKGGTYCVGS